MAVTSLARLVGVVGAVSLVATGCAGGGQTEAGQTVPVHKQARQHSSPEHRHSSHPKHPKVQAAWVALDGWEGVETLGLVMAEKRGFFEKSHLLVTTLAPITPALSIPDVLKGSDLIGVAHAPQAVIARAKGAPLVVIGSLVAHPTAAMIWLRKSRINDIADLKGKMIAIPGLSFQRDFLAAILARGGLTLEDVKVIKVGNELVPALASGKADAIFGGSGNLEGAGLRARGLEPVITSVRALGIGVAPYEELVLVARADAAAELPKVMHRFTRAVTNGAAAAVGDPKNAAKVLNTTGERNPEIGEKARLAETRKTVPLLSESGRVSPAQMKHLVNWMYEKGMIGRRFPVSELLARS